MNALLRWLGPRSYSTRSITRGCALILLTGGFIAALLSFLPEPGRPAPEAADVISDIYTRFVYLDYGEIQFMSGGNDRMPEGLDSLFIGPEERWLPDLESRSESADTAQGVRFALGLWRRKHQQVDEALALFHAENEAYPSAWVRRIELETALRHGDPEVLKTLEQDPQYAREMDSRFRMEWAAKSGNWLQVFRHFLQSQLEALRPLPVAVSLAAGTLWSLLLLSLLPQWPKPGFALLCLTALLLGAVSTWPTVVSGMWMDASLGLEEGTDFFSTLWYMLASVGLREEMWKAVLFSPFLLLTVRPGKDAQALLLGAFVGLGFAVEENIGYVMSNAEGVAVSRFVSANMLHFMLTGATALALTRAVRDPRTWALDSLQVLLMAIGLHAIYNTLLSRPVPGLGDMSYFHGAALVGCATLFFREVERLIPLRGATVSRTGVFCWGLCALFCLELIAATLRVGFQEGLYITGQAALASVFTGAIFIHFVREPLHA